MGKTHKTDEAPKGKGVLGSLYVAASGTFLLVSGVFLVEHVEALAGIAIGFGSALTVAAPLLNRLEGAIEVGAGGLKANVGKEVEQEARAGETISAPAILQALAPSSELTASGRDSGQPQEAKASGAKDGAEEEDAQQPKAEPSTETEEPTKPEPSEGAQATFSKVAFGSIDVEFTKTAAEDLKRYSSNMIAEIVHRINMDLALPTPATFAETDKKGYFSLRPAPGIRAVVRQGDSTPEDPRPRYFVMRVIEKAER